MVDYTVVDVFTSVPFKGNPVAVVLDGTKLSTDEMQSIARWTNLSETTFLFPPTNPQADYKLRIFTTTMELPFAGHPTLGSCHAAIEAGLVDSSKQKIIQECERGLITIEKEEDRLKFGIEGVTAQEFPIDQEKFGKCFPGLHPVGKLTRVDAGPMWLVGEVSDTAQELLATKPVYEEIEKYNNELNGNGFCIFTSNATEGSDIEMRTLIPEEGEDPVCGSGNAAVAYVRRPVLEAAGQSSYKSSQGGVLGRSGKIGVSYGPNNLIQVSGNCTSVVKGTINIP